MPENGGVPRAMEVRGVRVPRLVYGTAWKEDRTAGLTRSALEAGFRGIDTANQRKHYHEAGVGEAVQGAIRDGIVSREGLFLQTKFTYVRGQDHRLPYDPEAPLAKQVEQSFVSSLNHLGTDHVDAYLLHGPSTYPGLAKEDWEVWGAMERLHEAGRTRLIGVSNVTFGQLEELYEGASVKPAVVQSRTFTRPQADLEVRTFCREHGLAYEGFSLLTAAPQLLAHPVIRSTAARLNRTPAEVVLRFCAEQGMIVLTGTTSREHMAQDLSVLDEPLTEDEAEAFSRIVPAPAR